MKEIALAILSVGLCFYGAYRHKVGLELDWAASLVSIIAALMLLLS